MVEPVWAPLRLLWQTTHSAPAPKPETENPDGSNLVSLNTRSWVEDGTPGLAGLSNLIPLTDASCGSWQAAQVTAWAVSGVTLVVIAVAGNDPMLPPVS